MILILKSRNKKIGNIAATYLPINKTCNSNCSLKNNGCYAMAGYVNITNVRLEKQFKNLSAYDIVRKEAREIIKFSTKSDGKALRLHISGDARSSKSASLLGKAAKKWNGKVYTYTHSWRDIPRKSWGKISVLASVESISSAKQALKKGYAPALIVAVHNGPKAYIQDGLKIIPCPSQTKITVTCEKCKLCMNDKLLKDQNAAIGFAIHGIRKNKTLKVLQNEP